MAQATAPISFTLSNIIKYVAFMSPLLISFFMLMLSIINNNILKGIIFLVGLVIITFINVLLKNMLREKQSPLANPFCNILSSPFTVRDMEGIYSSPSLNSTIIAYTSAYLIFPMKMNNEINGGLLAFLIILLGFNGVFEHNALCTSIGGIILGIVVGILFGILYYSLIASSGNKELAYFSEITSNAKTCKKPSKQKFKCVTYKRGERPLW
jgi:hypothetical protein